MSESVSVSASVSVTMSMSMSMTLSVRKASFFSFFFSSLPYGATNIYTALAIVLTISKGLYEVALKLKEPLT
jgi:hypothetical protein